MIEAEPKYDYYYIGNFDPNYPYGTSLPCEFYSRSFMSRLPLGGGSPVVYREVTVWDGPNGEYGRTRHAFLVADVPPETIATSVPLWKLWPFHRHPSNYWRWGQELERTEYDAVNRIQRSVRSGIAFPADTETAREFRGISLNTRVGGLTWTWEAFRVLSAWKVVAGDTTASYDTTGTLSLPTIKAFKYGNPRHIQLTEVVETNSDGKQRITRLKYPGDYANGGLDQEAAALTAMRDSTIHMHNAVIERSVSDKSGSTEKVVQAEITTYRLFGAGQYLPFQRFILNSPSPIP